MAIDHSTNNTLNFQNVESPFIKLFMLLPQLQYNLSNDQCCYSTDTDTLKTLHQCAENSVEEILMNLPSLGTLLATAADNTDMGLLAQDVRQVGWLINSLSNILIACHNVKENTGFELAKRGVLIG